MPNHTGEFAENRNDTGLPGVVPGPCFRVGQKVIVNRWKKITDFTYKGTITGVHGQRYSVTIVTGNNTYFYGDMREEDLAPDGFTLCLNIQ